jgi:hypothetical protein
MNYPENASKISLVAFPPQFTRLMGEKREFVKVCCAKSEIYHSIFTWNSIVFQLFFWYSCRHITQFLRRQSILLREVFL